MIRATKQVAGWLLLLFVLVALVINAWERDWASVAVILGAVGSILYLLDDDDGRNS